ncbi:MAG TPA: helix-turn-helix transcriptional regulator, partial [Solirubrobacteraceae bacterium]|nr:helix-turn-helix transcriptional regulator [Solirubrobacteraceae bacterium]
MPESPHRDPDVPDLGRAIRRMREQRGISAEVLATATGISRQRIDSLERGRLDPTYELLLALTQGLGVQLSALVRAAEQL